MSRSRSRLAGRRWFTRRRAADVRLVAEHHVLQSAFGARLAKLYRVESLTCVRRHRRAPAEVNLLTKSIGPSADALDPGRGQTPCVISLCCQYLSEIVPSSRPRMIPVPTTVKGVFAFICAMGLRPTPDPALWTWNDRLYPDGARLAICSENRQDRDLPAARGVWIDERTPPISPSNRMLRRRPLASRMALLICGGRIGRDDGEKMTWVGDATLGRALLNSNRKFRMVRVVAILQQVITGRFELGIPGGQAHALLAERVGFSSLGRMPCLDGRHPASSYSDGAARPG